MNPVVGGTMLPPVSLQQPAAIAYVKSPVEGASMGASVTRFESAMAVGPAQHVAASAVQASPNVAGVQRIQPVERTGGPHGAYNDVNGQTRSPSRANAMQAPDATPAPDAVDGAHATDPAASVGDRILSSLRSVSDSAAHTWNALGQLSQHSSGNMNMQQMLSFQMGAMQASVQFDYVGKIISRATQNLDQLVKTQ